MAGNTMTLGPNLSEVVRPAMAASVVITSGTGTGEDRRSESQIESMSVRSQRASIASCTVSASCN